MKSQVEGCDSTVEVCSQVKVVKVSTGFKYRPSAFNTWGILAALITGYSTVVGSPYSQATDIDSAFLLNFVWMYITWATQLFFWAQKALFKSDGGFAHTWFIKFVNFSKINFMVFYWLIDGVIMRAILGLNSGAGEYWGKLGLLFGLQMGSVIVAAQYKRTLQFDYDYATAVPQDFVASTYDPLADIGELEQNTDAVDGTQQDSSRLVDESEISEFWGF